MFSTIYFSVSGIIQNILHIQIITVWSLNSGGYFGVSLLHLELNPAPVLFHFPAPDSLDVVLHCEPTYLQLDIPRSLIGDDFHPSELHFAGENNDPLCRAFYSGGSYITLNSSLTGCGTVYSVSYGCGKSCASFHQASVIPTPYPHLSITYLSLLINTYHTYQCSKFLTLDFRNFTVVAILLFL